MSLEIKGQIVKGNVIDNETRCSHYHTEKDRVAIKFYCCKTYFSCYLCHKEAGCGQLQTWPKNKFNQKGILCGACGEEMTINAYLKSSDNCPNCQAAFNPNCSVHKHYYFSI